MRKLAAKDEQTESRDTERDHPPPRPSGITPRSQRSTRAKQSGWGSTATGGKTKTTRSSQNKEAVWPGLREGFSVFRANGTFLSFFLRVDVQCCAHVRWTAK